MTTDFDSEHQYKNVELSTDTTTPSSIPLGATIIPIEPEEPTITPNDPHISRSILMEAEEATNTTSCLQGSTTIPTDPQGSTNRGYSPQESTTISIPSVELTIEGDTGNTSSGQSIALGNIEQGETSSDVPTTSIPLQITNTPVAPSISTTRGHHPPNLALSNHDPNMYPIPENDKDINVPPPPYWSINPANDILASPSPTVLTQPPIDGESLSTAPPPSYHTLYNTESPAGDVTPQQTQQSQEEPEYVPTPREKKLLWLYILVIGVAIPIFMVILKFKAECPANKQLVEVLVPGIIFHILHALATAFSNGKLLPWNTHTIDCFIFFIFGWNIAMSVYVYGLDIESDCNKTLYYFVLCLVTFYNVAFLILITQRCIAPMMKSLKNYIVEMYNEN